MISDMEKPTTIKITQKTKRRLDQLKFLLVKEDSLRSGATYDHIINNLLESIQGIGWHDSVPDTTDIGDNDKQPN